MTFLCSISYGKQMNHIIRKCYRFRTMHYKAESSCTSAWHGMHATFLIIQVLFNYFCIAAAAMSRWSPSGVINTHVSSGIRLDEVCPKRM